MLAVICVRQVAHIISTLLATQTHAEGYTEGYSRGHTHPHDLLCSAVAAPFTPYLLASATQPFCHLDCSHLLNTCHHRLSSHQVSKPSSAVNTRQGQHHACHAWPINSIHMSRALIQTQTINTMPDDFIPHR